MTPEFQRPLIGIDLGASYTKIGYRQAWLVGNEFDKDTKVLTIEGHRVVPSIAVHRPRANPAWLFGQEAANYVPRSGDKVYTNWKRDLFEPSSTPQFATSVDVAAHFFAWLGDQLGVVGVDARECNVRVCMPAFHDIAQPALILAEAMARNGWAGPRISNVTEPGANSVGIFTEGRNRLYKPPRGPLLPVLFNIYQSSVIIDELIRQASVTGFRSFSVAIVDIGSFTTDLQLVEYNVDAEPGFVQRTFQISHAIGMLADFEKPLFDGLGELEPFPFGEVSLSERERIKNIVCNGGMYVSTSPGGRKFRFGAGEQVRLAESAADALVLKIWNAVSRDIARSSANRVVLTGGGADARPIRESFKRQAQRAGITVMTLPSETEERHGISRLATAIGAGSVLFEFPEVGASSRARAVHTPAGPQECRCRGGNKNCMFCAGSGFYRSMGPS
jgi:hypothetical protein